MIEESAVNAFMFGFFAMGVLIMIGWLISDLINQRIKRSEQEMKRWVRENYKRDR